MKFNLKYIPYIVAVIAIVIAGFFYQRTQSLKLQEKLREQNYAAQTDSIRLDHNKKTGELEASKAAFVTKAGDLENFNKELADDLENTQGEVVTLSRVVVQLKQDTSVLRAALISTPQEPVTELSDSTYNINWVLMYQYDSLNYDKYRGVSNIKIDIDSTRIEHPINVKHNFTEILERESQIEFTFGQKVEDNQLRVFIRSKYPGFKPIQLEGVLIDPNSNPYIKGLMKKKHWFTGFGVGPSISLGYDFMNARPAVILGVGIHYSIYTW